MDQAGIGKFIAELRKEKKLTQEQLAEVLGVSNKTISRWENGRCMPDLSLLSFISDELGVSVSELLNGRRMTQEDMLALRDSINALLELSEKEKKVKTRRLNVYMLTGMICILIVLLNHQFGVLSFIFKENVDDFVAGALTSIGILSEIIGVYNNNHDTTFSQRKKMLLSKAFTK